MPRHQQSYAVTPTAGNDPSSSSQAAAPSEPAQREEDLALRVSQRSPEAWTAIYEQHSTAIFRYIRARVFEPETAEDLTSAVFSQAIKGAGTYKYRGQPILAWLYRIARNEVSTHQRRMLRRRAIAPIAVLSRLRRDRRETPGGAVEVVAHADRDAGHARTLEELELRDAMNRLSDSQREVMVLRWFVGLDTSEIARVVGKEPAAVYSLQARAIDALRRHLT